MEFPNIDPVAISIGPLVIRWYALAYLAGFLGGWRYALYIAGLNTPQRPDKNDLDDFMPWAVLGVILGGRIGYVLFYNFDSYASDPLTIFKIWQGGMAFHGGVTGVIAAIIGFSLFRKIELLRLSDIVCAVVPIGIFFGRIANFINGELYGRVTNAPWGIVFPFGGPDPRHPSQLYEAVLEGLILGLILFFMLRNKEVRNRPGLLTGTFLCGYGVMRFAVEFFREPDVHLGLFFEAVSMGQILSVPMILLGSAVITFALKAKRV